MPDAWYWPPTFLHWPVAVVLGRRVPFAIQPFAVWPQVWSQSSPAASTTRPSASKNLLGTWKIASISPPSGHHATWRLPGSRQTNSPAPASMPVVGQHRTGREPHQRRHQAGGAIEQQRLGLAAGKAGLLPVHARRAYDVGM